MISTTKYELNNHLGNVMAVISDRKIARDTSANDTVDYYEPDVLLTFDYSPFGAPLHARSFSKEVCHDTTFTMIVEDLNTNFDDGTTQGWTELGNTSLTVTSGGQLQAEKNGGGQTMGCTNSFMATSGVVYDFSIFIEKGSCNSAASILLEVLDPNNTVIYTQTLTSGAQTYSTQFTANVTGAYTINVTRIGNSSNCYFLIDDALVTHEEEVNELVCDNYGTYRFRFNGKEQDGEFSGDGNNYNYGFRIYNPRLGRFLSVDPLYKEYPWYTPYQFSGNTPIQAIDLDGLEILDFRSFYRLKVEKTEIGISYDLSPKNDGSEPAYFRKKNINLSPVNISYVIHKDYVPDLAIVPSSTKNDILYSSTQKQIDEQMGRKTFSGNQQAQKFIKFNNNYKPAKGNAIAKGIEFLAKYIYNLNMQEKDNAYTDLENVKQAFFTAYKWVQEDIAILKKNNGQAKFDDFINGLGVTQVQVEEALIQYIVDGTFENPVEATNMQSANRRREFGDFITKTGDAILKDAPKTDSFQNIERESKEAGKETKSNSGE